MIDKWISERDNGIYDAMNKGLKYAKGVWSIFINVGDELYFFPDILFQENYKHYDAILCPVQTEEQIAFPRYDWQIKYRNSIPHQGLFYNISSHNYFFDINYKVFADYELNLRIFQRRLNVYVYDKIVSFHSLNGISRNKNQKKEFYRIVDKYNGFMFVVMAFCRFKILGLKRIIKRVLRTW